MKNLLKVQIASRRQVKYYLVYTLLFSSHDAGFSTTPELMHWKFLRIMVSPSKKKMSYFLIEPNPVLQF